MLALLRKHWIWFGVFLALGTVLRVWFVLRYSLVLGDSFIYGDIALNWMRHGVYGFSELGAVRPTLIRLPGYPAFLVVCFKLFGAEHYRAVLLVQCAADLANAFVLAALAWEMTPLPTLRAKNARRMRHPMLVVFALYCLFPYTAVYVAAALTETLTLLALSLALLFAARALNSRKLRQWVWCGVACAAAVVLRPDGGMILISLFAYLGFAYCVGKCRSLTPEGVRDDSSRGGVRDDSGGEGVRDDSRKEDFWRGLARPVLILGGCTLLALAPWAARNYRTFHVFEPLAPAHAVDPGEFYEAGWVKWTATWMLDFASVQDIGWSVPGQAVNPELLPGRAFDSAQQRERTLGLVAQYNEHFEMSPELDAEFGTLAQERAAARPWRTHVWLPVGRVVDMWLRPRTEMFPVEEYWWQYSEHPEETVFAVAYAGVGIIFLLLAARGWWVARRRGVHWLGLLTFYIVLRTLFLLTVPTAEPRYTIECWPMALVLAGFAGIHHGGTEFTEKGKS